MAKYAHLTDDELDEVIEALRPIVDAYGTFGIEEAIAAINNGALEDDGEEA